MMKVLPPLRWRLAGLLFLAAAVNYLDRAAISISSPAIKQEFGLSDSQMGVIFGGFFFGYAFMNLCGGWAADRYGAKKVLGLSMAAWSLFCALTVTAQGFLSLLTFRILFGGAEGPFGAAGATLVSRLFEKREASSAVATIASGTSLGAVVAGPAVALLYGISGWRGALIGVSSIGLIFAFVWTWSVSVTQNRLDAEVGGLRRLDHADKGGKPAQTRSIEILDGRKQRRGGVLRYFRSPLIIANALAYFAYTYLLSTYLSWLPLFMTSQHGLKTVTAGLSSSIPWILAFAGTWSGGLLSDFIFRRTDRLLFSRRVVQVGAILATGVGTATLGYVASPVAAITIASISLYALFIAGTSFWTTVQDIVPSESIGTVSGYTHFIANLGGVVGPAVTGWLVQHADSYRSAWLVAGLLAIGAASGVIGVGRFVSSSRATQAQQGA